MPRKLDCPEVELRHSASAQAHFYPPYPAQTTSVDLLEIYDQDVQSLQGDGAVYITGLDHEDLVKHLDSESSPEDKPLLRILFVHGISNSTRQQGKPKADQVKPALAPSTVEYLIEHLGVSPAFMAVLTYKTWIIKTGNCLRVKHPRSETGDTQPTIEGWYRYSSELQGLPSHVWFSYTAGSATYIVNNCEHSGVQDNIARCVNEGMGAALLRPMAVDGFISEAISIGWGNEVLRPRSILVEYEHLDRTTMLRETSESIRELHIVSYNLLIIKEDMTDHIERLRYLSNVHDVISSTFGNTAQDGVDLTHTFSFLLSETQIRKRWVQSYADRIGIQINLFYNLSAQRDNRTNLKIADFTSRIATETQKDSSSMITMAAVTMFFLPGTFVSAIFSMVFFESSSTSGPASPTGLSVAKGWWLFPAITIPLTALVFAIWNVWRMRRNRLHIQDLQHFDSHSAGQTPPQMTGLPRTSDFWQPSFQHVMPGGENLEKEWDGRLPPDPTTVILPTYRDNHPGSCPCIIASDRTSSRTSRRRRSRARSSDVQSRRSTSSSSSARAPDPVVRSPRSAYPGVPQQGTSNEIAAARRMVNLSVAQPVILVSDLPGFSSTVR